MAGKNRDQNPPPPHSVPAESPEIGPTVHPPAYQRPIPPPQGGGQRGRGIHPDQGIAELELAPQQGVRRESLLMPLGMDVGPGMAKVSVRKPPGGMTSCRGGIARSSTMVVQGEQPSLRIRFTKGLCGDENPLILTRTGDEAW